MPCTKNWLNQFKREIQISVQQNLHNQNQHWGIWTLTWDQRGYKKQIPTVYKHFLANLCVAECSMLKDGD